MINLSTIKSMNNVSRADHLRSGRSALSICRDLIQCRRRYGTTAHDYLIFGFSMLGDALRGEYLSGHMLPALIRNVNGKNAAVAGKWNAYNKLKDFYRRDCVHLDASTDADIRSFLERHPVFFAKNVDGKCGRQVEYIEQSAEASGLIQRLRERKLPMLEEPIVQHETVSRFSVCSVNTLRFISVLDRDGGVTLLPAILRVSSDESRVDNHYGLLILLPDDDGVIQSEGFFKTYPDKTDGYLVFVPEHPVTGVRPKGVRIPFFREAADMVKTMASLVPELKIIGWDIAVTPSGPDLVELNADPGIEFHQNYYFTKIFGTEHAGVRRIVEEKLGLTIENDFSVCRRV